MNKFLLPNWPAPSNVKACTTLRTGGVSQAPYHHFNLAEHVGDDVAHVRANRTLLKKELHLSDEPVWIEQTHSTIVLPAHAENRHKEADASFTNQHHQVCIVLTADCLPLLICHREGTHVAAIHAGWRGLAGGIIQNTLQALQLPPEDLLVWMGPAISQKNYEVGEEVREHFLKLDPQAEKAFIPSPQQRWLANLYELARLQLKKLGVNNIYGGEYCTYSNQEMFFSYRRDGNQTGRMASLIWIK
jgi:YfiH family protein